MTMEIDEGFIFSKNSRLFVYFVSLILLGTLVLIGYGLLDLLMAELNTNYSAIGTIHLVVGFTMLPFTLGMFLYFYIPTKNTLTIKNDKFIFENYKEKREYDLHSIQSLEIKFIPTSKGTHGGSIFSIALDVADVVSHALRDEDENQHGKLNFEIETISDKKKITFLFLKFKDISPLIKEVAHLTSKEPIIKKYERKWELSS